MRAKFRFVLQTRAAPWNDHTDHARSGFFQKSMATAGSGRGRRSISMDGAFILLMISIMSENPAPAKRNSCLLKGLMILGILLLALGGFWWWHNRPITPVVLTPGEKKIVAEKVEAIQAPGEPKYEKGSREIVLTERELNGLLHENTALGKTVSLELATQAIHARIETDLDPNLPLLGGKHLKARARFLVGRDPGKAALALDDVTVWGISLPNDWLGGMKGRDLLGEALGGRRGGLAGVEEIRIEPGRLTIRLKE